VEDRDDVVEDVEVSTLADVAIVSHAEEEEGGIVCFLEEDGGKMEVVTFFLVPWVASREVCHCLCNIYQGTDGQNDQVEEPEKIGGVLK